MLKTIRVKDGSPEGYTIINETDFDESVHEFYVEGEQSDETGEFDLENATGKELDAYCAENFPDAEPLRGKVSEKREQLKALIAAAEESETDEESDSEGSGVPPIPPTV